MATAQEGAGAVWCQRDCGLPGPQYSVRPIGGLRNMASAVLRSALAAIWRERDRARAQ